MDDHQLLKKAMQMMGWSTDSDIPMANEENRLIISEIQKLYGEKENLLQIELQNGERLEKLQQHAKNSEVTINHNLKLLDAYQSEVRCEAHLFKLAARKHSKLKQDIKDVDKEWNNYRKFVETTEKEMCKRKQNIDNLTNRIKWAKTALIEWNQSMQDGNKGYQLIEMYYKDDQQRAKQQNQRRQKLRNDVENMRKQVIHLYDEQKTLECNLECTANLYRTAHHERRQMVQTWKQAVTQMIQVETDIRNMEMSLIDCKANVQAKNKEVKEYNNKFNSIIDSNHEIEAAIEELNSETSNLKEEIQMLSDMVILKSNEVDILQKELQNLGHRVEQQRVENRQNVTLKTECLEQLEHISKVVEDMAERYKTRQSEHVSAQQRLVEFEELMNIEEKNIKRISNEIERVNGVIYRSQQQLCSVKDELITTTVASDGFKSSIAAVQKNTENLEKNLKRENEIHYEMAFKILQMERRILYLQGGLIDPEVEERNEEYLDELEKNYNSVSKTLQSTLLQNKKLDDDMRKLTNLYNDDMNEQEKTNFQIKEAQVYCEGGAKLVKNETHRNQELIVELSILKMRVHEFQSQIDDCDEGTYNLIKHRFKLNSTIKDRLVEVKSQMDLLNLKRKHLNEELSTLKADVGERNKHINAVKARFELTSKLLGVNEDGTLITATQLRVETAQEKQLLLDEGNTLNDMVIKAEDEVKAMENTLYLFNNSNEIYRKKTQTVDDDEEASKELHNVQSNYCNQLSRLKGLRLQFNNLQKSNNDAISEKEELQKRYKRENNRKNEDAEFLQKLNGELQTQNLKLQRAERDLKAAIKAVKQKDLGAEYLDLFERDLDLKDIEKRNLSVLNQLSDIVDSDAEIGPIILQNIMEHGLKLPHLLKKSRSSISWRSDSSLDGFSITSDLNEQQSTHRSQLSRNSFVSEASGKEPPSAKLSVISLDFKK